jgi:hypothetical protein
LRCRAVPRHALVDFQPPPTARFAEDKIARIEAQQEKKQSPVVFLGLPSLSQLTARTSEATR